MARIRQDAGAISLRGLLNLSAIVCLLCLLFLIIDVRHRMTGYRAAYGQGIKGTVAVTSCGSHLTGTYCTGDFTSADGRVRRAGVRVNGAMELLDRAGHGGGLPGPVSYPAALSGAKAGEAWTLDGTPWLRPSIPQVVALVPVAIPVLLAWALLRGGPHGRRRRLGRARLIRTRRNQRRELSRLRDNRRGRVN
ncbi:MAG TPA: hypothetical protein VGP70_20690 [Actinomadura sp.]|jgi:hypothetical protein|nr:hypothetical protein [Actinomadura sp.]